MARKIVMAVVLGFLVCAAPGCSDSSGGDDYTAVMVTVQFNPQTYSIDQFRFEGYLDTGAEAFAPGEFPDTPENPFSSGEESVAIVLNDDLAGEVIRVRVHGLNQGNVVASGQNTVTAVLHDTVEVIITLGEPAICGDQMVRAGIEDCDDGNTAADDGCSPACVEEEGWICVGEPSTCTPVCGDGLIRDDEPCDDNNLADGDGCSRDCQVEQGFTCTEDEPSVCTPICGDGYVRGGEPCDDGNTDPGDGCSDTCDVETGWTCTDEPSDCVFPCDDHTQCDYVCDHSAGVCVDEADILFVECNPANCPGSGTLADPYCAISNAVAAVSPPRVFILVAPGTCVGFVAINHDLNLIGQPGAVIERDSCPAIYVDNAQVRIEGLVVRAEGSGPPFVGGGIHLDNGTAATLVGNSIMDSGCVGIHCEDSACVIHRNLVENNRGGGIDVDRSDYSIVNNIIAENGNNTSAQWGGVRIDATMANPDEFMNNTVVYNDIDNNQTYPGGVICVQDHDLVNSILWFNDNLQISNFCHLFFSNIEQSGFDGIDGNITADPDFVGANDYHIDPSNSPCLDTASATDAPDVDFDGDPRPLGLGVDMGADEAS